MAKSAGIVLIGNELLSGKVTDANAAYLCRELRQLGVDVRRITVIPDEVELIAATVAEFSRSFDLVFTSGGVGPTHDDVTMEGIARAFETRVIRHPALIRLLESFYRGDLNEARLRMAEVPEGAELFSTESLRFPPSWCATRTCCRACRDLPPEIRGAQGAVPRVTVSPVLRLREHRGRDARRSPQRGARRAPRAHARLVPGVSNAEYKVKVTLESKDKSYLDRAVEDFLGRLPEGSIVRVER